MLDYEIINIDLEDYYKCNNMGYEEMPFYRAIYKTNY